MYPDPVNSESQHLFLTAFKWELLIYCNWYRCFFFSSFSKFISFINPCSRTLSLILLVWFTYRKCIRWIASQSWTVHCKISPFHPIHLSSTHFRELLPLRPLSTQWMGLVSGAILYPSRRSGVHATSHWSSTVNEMIMGQESQSARVVETGTTWTSLDLWIKSQLKKGLNILRVPDVRRWF